MKNISKAKLIEVLKRTWDDGKSQAHPLKTSKDLAEDRNAYVDQIMDELEKEEQDILSSQVLEQPLTDDPYAEPRQETDMNENVEKMFPFANEDNVTTTRPLKRIQAYNKRQADRREGAIRFIRSEGLG